MGCVIGLILGSIAVMLATFTGFIIDNRLSSVSGFKYYSPTRLCLLQIVGVVVYGAVAIAFLFLFDKIGWL